MGPHLPGWESTATHASAVLREAWVAAWWPLWCAVEGWMRNRGG